MTLVRNWLLLYNEPVEVQQAVRVLLNFGVQPDALLTLVVRRKQKKRARGRPIKSRAFVDDLLSLVNHYKADRLIANEIQGIRCFLDEFARDTGRSKVRLRAEHESRLQKTLSRRRAELHKKSQ